MGTCKEHYVDNQGCCHRCGKPMNFDYWLSSIGPYAYRHPDEYKDEWLAMIEDWNRKNEEEETNT